MNIARHMLVLAMAGSGLMLGACSDRSASQAPAPAGSSPATGTTSAPARTGTVAAGADTATPGGTDTAAAGATSAAPTWADDAKPVKGAFRPPSEEQIPQGKFGDMVRKGRDIFLHTADNAGEYAGNDLNCSNCHLDAGRRADSAPMWAAWVRYPRYRSKNDKVNTFTERLQGCFQFSMNGKAPPADSEVIKALSTYAYWLATGVPTGMDMEGFGYPKQGYEPPEKPDYERGKKVFAKSCAMCHGNDGQGQKVAGEYVFPPLWGPESFNWGAGMHQLNNAAAFIKANMPLSRGGTLSDQEAWDVAMYMDSHERPQDPRFEGDIAATRKQYHDTKWSLYGTEVNGHMLGQGTSGADK